MPEIIGVRHLKIWVSDLAAARAWYEKVLGVRYQSGFEDDDGIVRGAAMVMPASGLQIALRQDPERARAMAGADPFALRTTVAELRAWANHLDALGIAHIGTVTAAASYGLAFFSPDGLQIRLYAVDDTVRADSMAADGSLRAIGPR